MISISVSGFVAAKPELLPVGNGSSRKCEFTVLDLRHVRVSGEWQRLWERVVFVAWDEMAERAALILDRGVRVSCTGLQESHQWTNEQGERRLFVRYRLTAWSLDLRPASIEARTHGAAALDAASDLPATSAAMTASQAPATAEKEALAGR